MRRERRQKTTTLERIKEQYFERDERGKMSTRWT